MTENNQIGGEQSRLSNLKRLNEIFMDLASIDERQIQNIDKILQKIIDRSKEVLGADLVEFYEYFQDQDRFKLPRIKSGEYIGEEVKKDRIYNDDVMYDLIVEKYPRYVETQDQVPEPLNKKYFVDRDGVPKERFYTREKIKSLAVIPIRAGEENVGLMFANYRTFKIFDDELRDIINLLAAQAAIVIRNARLYHHMHQRRKALVDVGVALSSQIGEANQESVCEAIYNEAKEKLEMENLSLSLYNAETDELSFIFAYFNGKPVDIENTPSLNKRKGINGKTGWVVENNKPLNIQSYNQLRKLDFYSYFYKTKNHTGYSWLGVPMRLGEKVIGVIATHNYHYDNAFSDYDVDTLQGLANIAAIAIHNVDLYNNIDDRAKKLASEIEEERNLLSTVINNVPAYIYAKDEDSKFIIANTTVAKIMGADAPDELIGKTDFDFYTHEEAEKYYRDEQNVIKTGMPVSDQKEFSKDLNGNPRVTLTTKVPWKDTHDRIIGTIGIGMEITELYEAQARLQAVIDQIPDHVYLKDKNSKFVLANTTVLNEFGLSSIEELIGKTDFDFHPPDLAQEYYDDEQKIIRMEQEPVSNKSEKISGPETGKIRRLLTTKLPFKNDHGDTIGIVGINRDITEGYRNYSIRQISEAAYNAKSLPDFYKGVYDILNEILPAENLYITVHIPEREAMNFLFYKSKGRDITEKEVPLNKGIAGYVFRNRKSLLASNEDLERLEENGKVERIGRKSKYWMGAPLIASKEVGVIVIQTYEDSIIYDHEDLALLEAISHPIAQAIERILKQEELEAESENRKKRLDALYKISEAARIASSLNGLYETVHGIIKGLMYAENIYIGLYTEGGQKIDLQYFKDEKDDSLPAEEILKRGLTGYVLRNGEPLLATPDAIDTLHSKGEIEIFGTKPIDWIGVPLKVKEKTIGIIAIQTYSVDHRYKEDDKDVISFVSEQIAMAIDQVRAKEIQIKALNQISSSIIAPTDIDKVIEGILKVAQEMMDETAICDILLWDKKEEKLKVKWVRGDHENKDFQVELGKGITGWVAKTREGYSTGNVQGDKHYKKLHSEIRSELAVPIINKSENELIGVLNIEHPDYNAFDEDDENMAMALGNLAAIAIVNKNLIKERESLKNLAQKLGRIV